MNSFYGFSQTTLFTKIPKKIYLYCSKQFLFKLVRCCNYCVNSGDMRGLSYMGEIWSWRLRWVESETGEKAVA